MNKKINITIPPQFIPFNFFNKMGKKNIFEPGTTDGKNFNFKGKIQTSVGKTDYVCSGSVNGDELSGIAKTKKGDLALNGIRK